MGEVLFFDQSKRRTDYERSRDKKRQEQSRLIEERRRANRRVLDSYGIFKK